MKISDLINDLEELLGKHKSSMMQTDGPENQHPHAELHVVTDVEDNGDDGVDHHPMVPPLQQKLELLKKAAGVPNVYDDKGSDELDDIKKLTGIDAVIQHEASEDNDITG